jgi:hypothetical protein
MHFGAQSALPLLSDVPTYSDHESPVRRLQGTEADFGRKFAAVCSTPHKTGSYSHRDNVRIGHESVSFLAVAVMEPFGNQELDRLADQATAVIAETFLHLCVCQLNASAPIDDQKRVRIRLNQSQAGC